MRVPDGLYTWNRVQAFGPSTPVLAEVERGLITHAETGGESLSAAQLAQMQLPLQAELRQRLIDADRLGARITRRAPSSACLTWAG